MKQHKSLICIVIVGLIFSAVTLSAWLTPSNDFSDSERRKLAQLPELSLSAIESGSFMSDFESYTQDQFPMRDTLRTLKSLTAYFVFNQSDNNGIYVKDGYAAQLEYPLNEDSLYHAADRFQYIYDKYLSDKKMNIYLSIVPDKSYFYKEDSSCLTMDYDALFSILSDNMSYAKYIDITDTLDITDYYKTDTHWRQEKLINTAARLAEEMGISLTQTYTTEKTNNEFYGVYYGQSALPLPSETIYYLTNSVIEECIVTNYENNSVGSIYDMDNANGKDPYEMFLSGSVSLITIENPNCTTDRELIIFRDSFASSIAPLLAEGYSKITLVDIRYLRADYLDRFIDFNTQDVLFLYSTLVLNNSNTLT